MSGKSLLALPRELRDLIFEYVLVKPENTITMLFNHDCSKSEVSAVQPALCRVNRQLRAETLPIFYRSNVFRAELLDPVDLATAKRWLNAIGDTNAGHLRRLILAGWERMHCGNRIHYAWVKVILHLRGGVVDFDRKAVEDSHRPGNEETLSRLEAAFSRVVEARDWQPFDRQSLAAIMDGFHELFTMY